MKSPSIVTTIRIHLKSTELSPSIESNFDFTQSDCARNFQISNSTADQEVLTWVKPTTFEDFESQGIIAGEEYGKNVYVGRTIDRDGNYVAAKIVPALESAFYTFNGVEESSGEVERLDNIADYHWVKSNVANLSDAVVVSGSYIGRGSYKNSIVVGSIDPKTNELVGSYDGKAVNLPSYDVLIYKSKGVVYEAIQKASNNEKFKTNESTSDPAYSMRTVVNPEGTFLNDRGFGMKTVGNDDINDTAYQMRTVVIPEGTFLNDKGFGMKTVGNDDINDTAYQMRTVVIPEGTFLNDKGFEMKTVGNDDINDTAYQMRTVVIPEGTFLNDRGFSMRTVTNGVSSEETKHGYNYMSLMSKIRQLEMENLSYRRDRQSYEERFAFEQQKVAELSHQVKTLRIENARFSKERFTFEEKFTSEQTKFTSLEVKVREYSLNNSYLLKKVNSLEEAIRYEKLLVESLSERFNRDATYSKSLLTKVTNFEETIKTQQQRIFELEGEIMMTTSSSESLTKKVTDYEETIKYLRLQMETYIKKLEISSGDNDFLVQKLSMLTVTLRNHQSQLECLTNKLQSSKTVIATAHADLSRANAQISKYQAALSSCYVTNGELSTKVSGLTAYAQNQVGSDCSLNLVNHNSGVTFGSSVKSIGYGKTSTLLAMTGSDSYLYSTGNAQPYDNFQSDETAAYDGNFNPIIQIPVPTPAMNVSNESEA